MSVTIHERQDCTREPAGSTRDHARSLDMPIDWAHLSRFTLNDRALGCEVLALFAKDAPRHLTLLLGTQDRKSWIEAAHTLKGSARAVGAWAVAECAQAIEVLEISASGEFAEKRLSRSMELALEKLVDALRRTLSYIDQLDCED